MKRQQSALLSVVPAPVLTVLPALTLAALLLAGCGAAYRGRRRRAAAPRRRAPPRERRRQLLQRGTPRELTESDGDGVRNHVAGTIVGYGFGRLAGNRADGNLTA